MNNETMFRDIIGTSPESKILEYFVEWHGVPCTQKDLIENTKTSQIKTSQIVKRFELLKIIKKDKKHNNAQTYIFNDKNIISQIVRNLFAAINIDSINKLEELEEFENNEKL